jgi:hypothetical protein
LIPLQPLKLQGREREREHTSYMFKTTGTTISGLQIISGNNIIINPNKQLKIQWIYDTIYR